jgi:hypothetical protein
VNAISPEQIKAIHETVSRSVVAARFGWVRA